MCLVHPNLEKVLEEVLPGHQVEEWGTTAGDKLGAGEKTMLGVFSFPQIPGSLVSVQ